MRSGPAGKTYGPVRSYASVVSTPRHSSVGTLRLVERSDRIDRFVHDSRCLRGELSRDTGRQIGFVSNGGTFIAIDFPGATGTVAAGINTAGDIVGQWSDATASHGFLLQAGVFTPINFPLATSTTAFGINDTGEIAGYYTDAAGNTHGFVYALRPSAQWTLQAPAAPS